MSGLLAYTTKIPEFRTLAEITKMLSQSKARSILQEYNGAGDVDSIAFRIDTQFGEMQFRLPSNVLAVDQALKDQHKAGKIDRRFANDSRHSRRVAWRILRHWLEAQLALVTVGMAKPEEVFLPYAQDQSGKTVFEALQEKKFSGLALTGEEIMIASDIWNLDLRSLAPALFIFLVAIMFAAVKAAQLAYHKGRRDFRDEHVTAILRPDHSVKQRL